MNKVVETKALFDCRVPYLAELFENAQYPWALLPQIGGHIQKLLEAGLEGFTLLKPGVLVGQNVQIAATAVIEGPAIIGHDTVLRPGAYVRQNVITGQGCVMGNSCEYKNCILLDGVQTPHYNYIGDSILGNKAHTGAGVVCSNLKADGSNIVIHGQEEIPTGLRKIGGILGDGADVGCNCVLNPGTVIGRNTSVYPLTALRGVYPENAIVKGQKDVVPRRG